MVNNPNATYETHEQQVKAPLILNLVEQCFVDPDAWRAARHGLSVRMFYEAAMCGGPSLRSLASLLSRRSGVWYGDRLIFWGVPRSPFWRFSVRRRRFVL